MDPIRLLDILFADQLTGYLTIDDVRVRYDIGSTATTRAWIARGILPRPHGVNAVTREMLWDVTKLPDPSALRRPKRGRPYPTKTYRQPESRCG